MYKTLCNYSAITSTDLKFIANLISGRPCLSEFLIYKWTLQDNNLTNI